MPCDFDAPTDVYEPFEIVAVLPADGVEEETVQLDFDRPRLGRSERLVQRYLNMEQTGLFPRLTADEQEAVVEQLACEPITLAATPAGSTPSSSRRRTA